MPRTHSAATSCASKLTGGQTVRLLTLNTGYGGLDAGEDFFMDGGEGVRPSDAETVRQNMLGIEDLIRGADADFVMLGRSTRIRSAATAMTSGGSMNSILRTMRAALP